MWWMPKIYLAVNIEELFSRFSCVVAGDSGLGKKTVLAQVRSAVRPTLSTSILVDEASIVK